MTNRKKKSLNHQTSIYNPNGTNVLPGSNRFPKTRADNDSHVYATIDETLIYTHLLKDAEVSIYREFDSDLPATDPNNPPLPRDSDADGMEVGVYHPLQAPPLPERPKSQPMVDNEIYQTANRSEEEQSADLGPRLEPEGGNWGGHWISFLLFTLRYLFPGIRVMTCCSVQPFFFIWVQGKKISIQACYFVLADEKHIFKAVLNHHIAALAIKSSDVAFRCRICFSWGVLVQGVDVGAGANVLFTCWVVHSLSPHHWTKHFTAAAKHHIFISPSESDGFLMSCVAEDWGRRVSRVSSFIKQFFPLRWRPPDIFLLMCLWGSVYRLPWWKYLHSWFSDRYK